MAYVYYPQGNGQAERINQSIVTNLERKLDAQKGRWVKELYHVLWAYRTKRRTPTGESPFTMLHDVEVMIPTEMIVSTLKTYLVDRVENDRMLTLHVDLV